MAMMEIAKTSSCPGIRPRRMRQRFLSLASAVACLVLAASGMAHAQTLAQTSAQAPAQTSAQTQPPAPAAQAGSAAAEPAKAAPAAASNGAADSASSDASPVAAPSAPASPETQKDVAAARDALVQVLQDPVGRAALVGLLEGLGKSGVVSGQTAEAATSAQAIRPVSAAEQILSGRIGDFSRQAFGDVVSVFKRISVSLKGLQLLFTGQIQVKWDKVQESALQLAAALGAAIGIYWLLRLVGRFGADWLVRHFSAKGWYWRIGLLLVLALGDVVALLLGVVVAVVVVGIMHLGQLGGEITVLESLALEAFLAAGVARILLRLLLSPDYPSLRMVPFSTTTSRYWAIRIGALLSLLVYGVILAVPIANITMSLAVGNALRVIVILAAAAIAVSLVVRNEISVRLAIQSYATTLDGELGRSVMHLLGRMWAFLAILYTLVVLGIWITRPLEAMEVVVNATFFSIVTLLAGGVSSMLLTRKIAGGIRMPEHISETLPALEGRINSVVPHLLKVVRLILFVVTAAVLLDIWSVIDLVDWLKAGAGTEIVGRFASAGFVVLLGCLVWLAVMSWVDLRLRPAGDMIVSARERTLFQLFRNAFTVVIIVMTGMLTLSELGLDIGPLIAGAGVLGLAVSFGAQTLVKDIITGAFIQIENAINEGDVITVAGITGTVERLTVRSVRIRDIDGTTHIIPFSSVDMVSNFMRDFSYHVAVIGVSYTTDIDLAKNALKDAFDRLKASPAGGSIIGDLEMHGVIAFGDSAVNIRARIKTFPGAQWATGRAYNEYVKRVFDEKGIDIPFPQVTYHVASDSTKSARSDEANPVQALAKDAGTAPGGGS